MYEPPPANRTELLRSWHKRFSLAQEAHYAQGKKLISLHWWLGAFAAGLSAVTGSATFAAFETGTMAWLGLACSATCIVMAVLVGLTTFSRFAERAEAHRNVAARYEALKRRAEQILAAGGEPDEKAVEILRREADQAAADAPHLARGAGKRAGKTAGGGAG